MNVSAEELTCREMVDLITAYLEGSLPGVDVRRFDEHLRQCPYCETWLQQMRQTIRVLGQLSEDTIDPRARDELLAGFRDWKRDSSRHRGGSPGS